MAIEPRTLYYISYMPTYLNNIYLRVRRLYATTTVVDDVGDNNRDPVKNTRRAAVVVSACRIFKNKIKYV